MEFDDFHALRLPKGNGDRSHVNDLARAVEPNVAA